MYIDYSFAKVITILGLSKRDHGEITGSVLLIIFYVENLDVGSWGVKNDV